jgi:cation:H+ antiporter
MAVLELLMSSFAMPVLVLIFAGCAAIIWMAGTQLSNTTDILDDRLHLGSALGGVVLLAVATNLPEIAITVAAAISGNLGLAVGNILGGIAIQTVVLVVLDAAGGRGAAPLTYRAASLGLVLEGGLVIAVLTAAVMGSQLPHSLHAGRVAPASVLIAILWVGGVLLLSRSRGHLPWQEAGEAPDGQKPPRGHSKHKKNEHATAKKVSTLRATTIFGVAAVATLASGYALEQSGEQIAGHIGLTGVLFGSTILAAATALPELSTGITSVRLGDTQLAISDIFGGNAFLPVLFLVAALISGTPVLPQAHNSDIYLTGLGILLTTVYISGLIFRPKRTFLRIGPDSLAVVILYALGIAGLFAIAG